MNLSLLFFSGALLIAAGLGWFIHPGVGMAVFGAFMIYLAYINREELSNETVSRNEDSARE